MNLKKEIKITKQKIIKLEKELNKAKKKLNKLYSEQTLTCARCKHVEAIKNLVFYRNYYQGSYSYDYDDAGPVNNGNFQCPSCKTYNRLLPEWTSKHMQNFKEIILLINGLPTPWINYDGSCKQGF